MSAPPVAVDAVLSVLSEVPGGRLSRSAAAAALGGRRTTALNAIDQALTEGVIHYETGHCRSRAGSVRSTRVLSAGPALATPAVAVSGSELARRRHAASLSQQALATRLGVSRSLIHRWETGLQPVPGWATAQLSAALALPTELRKPRQDERLLRGLVTLVRAHPEGITRRAIRAHLGNTPRLHRVIDRAVADGLVAVGPLSYAGARGARRPGYGLLPAGHKISSEQSPIGVELRHARLAAGWGLAPAARRLDIAVSTLSRWERSESPLPPWIAGAARGLLQTLSDDQSASRLRLALVLTLHRGPRTREQLERGSTRHPGFGRSTQVRAALDSLLEQGRIVETYRPIANAPGQVRLLKVLVAAADGTSQGVEPALTGPDLETARRAAGLTRAQLGALLDPPVSKVAIGHWEHGRQTISPGRAEQIQRALEQAGTAIEPLVDPLTHTDQELEGLALDALAANPGITARQLGGLLRGTTQRRLATIQRLIDQGRITAEPHRKTYQDGRVFTVRVLSVPASPLRSPNRSSPSRTRRRSV